MVCAWAVAPKQIARVTQSAPKIELLSSVLIISQPSKEPRCRINTHKVCRLSTRRDCSKTSYILRSNGVNFNKNVFRIPGQVYTWVEAPRCFRPPREWQYLSAAPL